RRTLASSKYSPPTGKTRRDCPVLEPKFLARGPGCLGPDAAHRQQTPIGQSRFDFLAKGDGAPRIVIMRSSRIGIRWSIMLASRSQDGPPRDCRTGKTDKAGGPRTLPD